MHDVTDDLSAEVKQIAQAITASFDCPLLGVNFISPDISQVAGKITELNPSPGITIHHRPTVGQPRDVARAIVDGLFSETKPD